jgi:hypothetical protein
VQLTSCTRHADAQLLLWPVRLKLILGQLGTLIYVLYGVRHAEVQRWCNFLVVTGATGNVAKLRQRQDMVVCLSKVEGTFCAAQTAWLGVVRHRGWVFQSQSAPCEIM